jgi:formylmethanofuran--tetrahydromethanopterin N-formyltransferase
VHRWPWAGVRESYPVNIRGVFIEDTFAEAFTMRVARLVITARSSRWAREAALNLTGFATSVIGCKVEAAIERELAPDETPDGRPGFSVLLMTMSKDDLPKRLIERVGQTVLTCPTTACFDGLPEAPDRVGVGSALRFFGDGFQASKVISGERFWRIPVMEGEFLVQEKFGMVKGVGGGNFLMLARSADAALEAAEAAAEAMSGRLGVILPFPGGVVRSGSKVGSRRIKSMIASTNDAFCPTLRAVTETLLPDGVNSVLEIVINGTDADVISGAMRAGIDAACREGVVAITAGNYGGKLGPHHFHLRKIMGGGAPA